MDRAMSEFFNHGYALLIGVGRCEDSSLSLPVTVTDMQELRKILVNPALCAYPDNTQHVQLLHDENAMQSKILDGLAWLRDCVADNSEATVIVYYSGHGWLEQSTDCYYLIPHDFDRYDWRDTAQVTSIRHYKPSKQNGYSSSWIAVTLRESAQPKMQQHYSNCPKALCQLLILKWS